MSHLLDRLSEYLARRKGLVPLLGVLLVLLNLLLVVLIPDAWLARTNLALHLGIIVAVLGLMIAWAL